MLHNLYKNIDIGDYMDALTTAPQTESKDIKLSGKKIGDSKSEEGKEFFENIISGIISESEDGEHKSFLLSKLLNLSSEFEKKEEVLSDFSDGALFTDHQIGKVSVQDLLKVAVALKDGEDLANFPTDSKTLKLALLKPEVIEQFKEAKNIKDLLAIAKKNNIEVKNFQFFKEEAALDPKDKKMVQKIKSEEIFKLIEKQLDTKAKLNVATLNNPKELQKQNDTKTTILQTVLQTVLASKEIIKPISEKEKPIANLTKSETKHAVTENKEVKIAKTTVEQSKEIKVDEPKVNHEDKKIVELKTTETVKHKAIQNSFQSTINLQKTNEANELQNRALKTEVLPEKVDLETESSDKTAVTAETKMQTIDKAKSTPDIKRTFSTFAEEFKEKVENYKPPLMKIKMELKPAGLGEVDVTLLTRGNNLQVNINSNSSTIAMFMQNQAEFKNSLINMGFSDLQMNFSDQQKKEQDAQNQKNGKNVFEQFDDIEEEQDGFEMIIPQYV